MTNDLISGKLNDKIKWYIRAHGHSSIGALNLLIALFHEKEDRNLNELIDECINNFKNFSTTDNLVGLSSKLKDDIRNLQGAINNINEMPQKKQEMIDIMDGVWKNVERIQAIINNPGYEEEFELTKILSSTFTELLERYPDVLYGDFVGIKGKDVGEIIKISFSKSGNERPIRVCGYEIQLLFFNLISNAIDAIIGTKGYGDEVNQTKGNIDICFTFKEDTIVMEFIDDGDKIPDDLLEKISKRELFSTKGGSHGMGMKIIYDLIEKYRANFSVLSDEKTKFIITLNF
jgi:signal transduction histidine kinase